MEKNHYDMRTGMRVTCLPAERTPAKAHSVLGHVVSAMSEQSLREAMLEHEAWLKSPQHD